MSLTSCACMTLACSPPLTDGVPTISNMFGTTPATEETENAGGVSPDPLAATLIGHVREKSEAALAMGVGVPSRPIRKREGTIINGFFTQHSISQHALVLPD